jgi:hypothetical protein
MNASTLLTPTQQVLVVWTLLGLLLAWLIIFAVLALRSSAREKNDLDDLPTPSRSFPALTAPATLHVMTSSSTGVPLPVAAVATFETSNDGGYTQGISYPADRVPLP